MLVLIVLKIFFYLDHIFNLFSRVRGALPWEYETFVQGAFSAGMTLIDLKFSNIKT